MTNNSCKIFFAGDVVLGERCSSNELLSPELKKIVDGCDAAVCNFEAPIATNLTPLKKIGPNNSNYAETINILKTAGFNTVTLANNHIFDYGIEGIKRTVNCLSGGGISYFGAGLCKDVVYKPKIVSNGNISVGIINAAENGFGAAVEDQEYGYAYIFDSRFRKTLEDLKSRCNFIIAVIHAGAEMWDFPLPEWRTNYKKLIDAGVNVVIGHHPHVPQGWETYNGGTIFYSLGNFAFNKGTRVQNPSSMAVFLTIGEGSKYSFKVIPTVFKDGTVTIDSDDEAMEHLRECCAMIDNNEEYMELVNKKCIETYESIYKNAYLRIACVYRGGIKERAKGFIKKHFTEKGFQDIWLYHNITIESHLYVCKRASKILLQNEGIL